MDNDTHARKEQLYQELQEFGRQISTAITELKERREQRNELTRQAQEQKVLRKELSKVIKDKIAIVKDLRQKRGERPHDHREFRESPGKIREEIGRMERKIETSGMDFESEQKLTKVLKEKKLQLAKIGGEIDLDRQIRSMSKEIDKLKRDSDVAHEHVTKAAKESQEHHERMLVLSRQVEDWKKQEQTAKDEYLKLKDQLAATQELPKKAKKPSGPSENERQVLAEKAAEVEQKVKDKKKLTTEDLLAFQAHK